MKILKILDRCVELVSVAIFATSFLLICINVLNRYLVLGLMRKLSSSLDFMQPPYTFLRELFGTVSVTADEVPGLLLVWIAFLGAYLVFRRGGHISFELLVDSLSPPVRRVFLTVNKLLIGGFLLLLLWQSVRMIRVSGATEIETAEIAQGWFMLILPVTAVLMLLALVTDNNHKVQNEAGEFE